MQVVRGATHGEDKGRSRVPTRFPSPHGMHDIGMTLQGRDETGKPRVARGPSDDGRQGEMEDGQWWWWWWCGG
jgi:hypothetical protein